MKRKQKRTFVATVARDGDHWCARILGLRDVFAQGYSLGETAERLRWVLTARLATDEVEQRNMEVEFTLVFSPTGHCQGCC